jgi:hypothetical protein
MDTTDFQKDIRVIDTLDNIYFDGITAKNVKKFYETKARLREIIRNYQVVLMRLRKAEEISTMREFERYKHLETNSLN